MVHGPPHSYDDAILESGNRNAKTGKHNLFWGGTSEVDNEGKKIKYAQRRSTGKRDANGELIMRTVMKTANDSIEVVHLENTHLRQQFQMARPPREKTEAVMVAERAKSEAYATQCNLVSESLSKLCDVCA